MPLLRQSDPTPGRVDFLITVAVAIVACLIPVLAISSQSFWIDEALTGLKAAQPSLAGWWHQMSAEKLSDLQMPLYMLYTWCWAKLFGTSEWALRAANLPWFIGGLLAFAFSFRGASRLFAVLAASLSSFAWFYLDEARPYAMQLGTSLLAVASLRRLTTLQMEIHQQSRWVRLFCVSIGVLAGTSLLGVFWCGAAMMVAGAAIGTDRLRSLMKEGVLAWLILGAWALCLAVYYAWTIKVGARASAMATTTWQSAFFIGYELLGFSGLGPGRLEIRSAGLNAFRPFVPWLAIYAACLTSILALGVSHLCRRQRRAMLVAGGVVCGTFALLLAAGWFLHFRLLGRHCAPAFAALVLPLTCGAEEMWWARRIWPRILLCGFLVMTLVSCLSARFAARHRKDDYRAATAFARTALRGGDTVWWSADLHGGIFYGLKITEMPEAKTGEALGIANPTSESLAGLPSPKIVLCSKPDLYDAGGVLAQRLAREHFQVVARLTAFTVWARPP